jgi:hypothetical protein
MEGIDRRSAGYMSSKWSGTSPNFFSTTASEKIAPAGIAAVFERERTSDGRIPRHRFGSPDR